MEKYTDTEDDTQKSRKYQKQNVSITGNYQSGVMSVIRVIINIMPIVFSEHAKQQLKRRRISQQIVVSAIKSTRKTISSFKNRKLRQNRVGGKLLEVVTKTEGSRITVITAYYLEEKL